MNNWMLVSVRFTKQLDNGTFKRVTEKNLFSAISFSEAEERVYKEVGEYVRGEFTVTAISKEDYHDIFGYDGEGFWFKCKVSYASMEDDGGEAKKVKQTFLVQAESIKQANDRLLESLSTLLVDFEVDSIVKTSILEVFPSEHIEESEELKVASYENDEE